MTYYIGILEGIGDIWGVRIPDCPGAFGAGTSPEDAVQNAVVGLSTWAEATLKDGEALSASRSSVEIMADPEEAPCDDDVAVMIPLLLDAGRTVRANLTLDAGLLAMIDLEAARRGLTRSAFLASAARDKIAAV